MNFSVVPLLLTGKSISPEARQALRENRMQDAAAIFMEQYGLNCSEAGQLLDLSMCEEDEAETVGNRSPANRAFLRTDPEQKFKA